MSRPVELERSSDLAAPRAAVWAVVSTMAGVNAELMPFVRMTHPPELASIAGQELEPGTVVFRSWLLAGGVVPMDRHALALVSVDDDPAAVECGFVEESTSWLQRRWRHERRLTDLPGGGCRVTDRLVVVPRLPFARPVVARVVARIFDHRHRRLVARFGPAPASG